MGCEWDGMEIVALSDGNREFFFPPVVPICPCVSFACRSQALLPCVSFPSSAWECVPAKLCFAPLINPPDSRFTPMRKSPVVPCRSQAPLGKPPHPPPRHSGIFIPPPRPPALSIVVGGMKTSGISCDRGRETKRPPVVPACRPCVSFPISAWECVPAKLCFAPLINPPDSGFTPMRKSPVVPKRRLGMRLAKRRLANLPIPLLVIPEFSFRPPRPPALSIVVGGMKISGISCDRGFSKTYCNAPHFAGGKISFRRVFCKLQNPSAFRLYRFLH